MSLPTVSPARRSWVPVEIVAPGPEGRAPRLVRALGDRAPGVRVLAAARIRHRRGLPRVRAAGGLRGVRRHPAIERGHGSLRRLRGAGPLPARAARATSGCAGAGPSGSRNGPAAWRARARAPARSRRRATAAGRRRGARRRPRRRARSRRRRARPRRDPRRGPRRPAAGPHGPRARRHDLDRGGRVGAPGRARDRAVAPSRTIRRSSRWCRATRPGSIATERQRRARGGVPGGLGGVPGRRRPRARAALGALDPITLLVSSVEGQTICLLALDPDGVPAFGRAARELAGRDVRHPGRGRTASVDPREPRIGAERRGDQ